jgi:hypothetical protein
MFLHNHYAISCVVSNEAFVAPYDQGQNLRSHYFAMANYALHGLIILPINKLVIVHLEMVKFLW